MGRIRTIEPLARSDAADLANARRHLDALVAASRQVVLAAGHDADVALCADAGCGLAAVPDGPELCRVAQQLSTLSRSDGVAAMMPLDEAIPAFRATLTEALDAVRACRQTAHPVGLCWFASVSHVDGCADVLRLAHRLG